MNGDEFKACRKHLISHLDGCISWRHPEDAVAQRERLKMERNAQRQQMSEQSGEVREESEVTPVETVQAAVEACDEEIEDEEIEQDIGFSMSMM